MGRHALHQRLHRVSANGSPDLQLDRSPVSFSSRACLDYAPLLTSYACRFTWSFEMTCKRLLLLAAREKKCVG